MTLALKVNNPKAANIVAIGAMIKKCGLFEEEKGKRSSEKNLRRKRKKANLRQQMKQPFMEGYHSL